ncbi:hypothetical protein, partial [Streptococcus pneumoniae]|uniref:hypothetical protein n=1 Tax=Streptococcus pneumoniae TaxID=1313 RepID=UPI001E309A47
VRLDEEERNVIKFKKRERPVSKKELNPAHAEYLASRKIDEETIRVSGVYSQDVYMRDIGEVSCISFPYGHAAKHRATHIKAFSCSGAPSTF